MLNDWEIGLLLIKQLKYYGYLNYCNNKNLIFEKNDSHGWLYPMATGILFIWEGKARH